MLIDLSSVRHLFFVRKNWKFQQRQREDFGLLRALRQRYLHFVDHIIANAQSPLRQVGRRKGRRHIAH